jgi:hypothetical protein
LVHKMALVQERLLDQAVVKLEMRNKRHGFHI